MCTCKNAGAQKFRRKLRRCAVCIVKYNTKVALVPICLTPGDHAGGPRVGPLEGQLPPKRPHLGPSWSILTQVKPLWRQNTTMCIKPQQNTVDYALPRPPRRPWKTSFWAILGSSKALIRGQAKNKQATKKEANLRGQKMSLKKSWCISMTAEKHPGRGLGRGKPLPLGR